MQTLPLERVPPAPVLVRGLAVLRTREAGVVLFILGLGLALHAWTGRFLTPTNLANVLLNSAPTAVVALGMTLVILTGGIDVSVGSTLGVTAVLLGYAATAGWHLGLLIAIGVLSGLVLGMVNGGLVARAGVMPIIATLATLSLYRALTFQLLRGKWIADIPPVLRPLGLGTVGGVPVAALLALALTLLFAYVTARRPLGRHIYAVGGNAEAARLAGIDVARVAFVVYGVTGMLVGVAALLYVGQTGFVQSNTGVGFELQVIAAVVLGGTSILGGRGSVVGSVLGAVLVGQIKNGLILMNVSGLAEGMVAGVLILLAVAVDLLRTRRGTP
ncbi:MAG: ABC transporter permease [Armatimonadota bacterium]|nr:ABC transporter permease [Armatimonadota bacterium]MDR7449363.1 ABC transporter permease [Armatimonadota bacterium]MDR7458352.1 ABC transporter permease [Armatimonadota bacterium]MDR7478843.1 ABC transporter permease [Armatimonadota bacterium]MDR7488729.1 ABC transporter permease [Armatimonadota bacterium]